MSDLPHSRQLIIDSIRDYAEQLLEEGLEGLPAPRTAPAKPLTTSIAHVAAATPAAPTTRSGAQDLLTSYYPGLGESVDLTALRSFIGDCRRCKLHSGRTHLVFGVGDPKARLMFVGEAPGADEDAQGEPFVGRAGQLLTDIIERGMRLKRTEVYICNVIKCRPPGNRNPEPDEVAACQPFLWRQIALVKPEVIVGLGTFAVHALLNTKTPIGKLRGHWQRVQDIPFMPTFHPAYLLRNPGDKRLVWADVQEVMRALKLNGAGRLST
ncbi:MAG TPA: uracil-DNA glycosylase [Candidatus Binataceae bacterium]|nr:uracil-DNA glycosylase [Candidatus Binataceae bacterium]